MDDLENWESGKEWIQNQNSDLCVPSTVNTDTQGHQYLQAEFYPTPAGVTPSMYCFVQIWQNWCQSLERDLGPGHWKTESSFASLRKGACLRPTLRQGLQTSPPRRGFAFLHLSGTSSTKYAQLTRAQSIFVELNKKPCAHSMWRSEGAALLQVGKPRVMPSGSLLTWL